MSTKLPVATPMSATSSNRSRASIYEDGDPNTLIMEEKDGTSGTFHQSQLNCKPTRKYFFSPWDTAYVDAVHQDASSIVYTEDEERQVKRKIDRRILPLVICTYFANQFDRINIGNAHVFQAFNNNFEITNNNKWTTALSIFYVGYCLLEMPANMLQRYLGADRYFFLPLTIWGVASLSFTYAKGYTSLIILRVFLGIGEAGYYAGMIYYLSFWYKRHEIAFRVSLVMNGPLAGAISGLLAFGLVRAHTSVLTGWQFLFLVEAIPSIILAFAVLFYLPSFPFAATFLSPRERAIAQARLNRDHRPRSHGGMAGWQAFKSTITDLNAWLFTVAYCGFAMATTSISYFVPTVIHGFGFSPINTQGLTVAPYLCGCFIVFFQCWHSDHTKERSLHFMLSCTLSLIGYIILATCAQKSIAASYFALFLVIGNNYSLYTITMSWAASTFSPTSKRGIGTAFIVSISNCLAIAAPQIYFDPEDKFRKGHAITAGCVFVSFIGAVALRARLISRNQEKARMLARMTSEEKVVPEMEELWDSDPRYFFII